MKRALILMLLMGSLSSLTACVVQGRPVAQERPPAREAILDRIENQQHRINQGIRSDELTKAEADILQDNLDWIRKKFTQMKRDGRLNPREVERLDEMLDRNDKMIYNKKHNPIERVYQNDRSERIEERQPRMQPPAPPEQYEFRQSNIPERIETQQQRINQGIRSGELTRREADVLQDNLDWIRKRFSQATRDGRLNHRESERLDEMLNQNSDMIQNKKRNPVNRLY